MEDAALVFVREDSNAAERLAGALERAGVSVCRSASVFEDPDAYGAVVALFSPAAVRSRLVMDAAARAREEGRLVAVFVGLCPLPPVFSGIAMFDLSSWGGQADDAAVTAVAAQIRRAKQVRAAKAGLERNLGSRGQTPPLAKDAYPQESALHRADFGWQGDYGRDFPQPDHQGSNQNYGSGLPIAALDTQRTYPQQSIEPRPNTFEDRPRFGGDFGPSVPANAQDSNPVYSTGYDGRMAYGAPTPPAHPANQLTPRRFAGLTPTDDHNAPPTTAPVPTAENPRAWADAWVAAELRSRGVAPPAGEPSHRTYSSNQAAYRDFGGQGASYPSSTQPVAIAPPIGNSFDTPAGKSRGLRSEPWTREDPLGYERPPGAQDPVGAPTPSQHTTPPRRRRSDSLFAIALIAGLAAAAVGAVVFSSANHATLASAPLDDTVATSQSSPVLEESEGAASLLASGATATAPAAAVRRVSLNDALGDSTQANREPARGGAAGADRGVERRRPNR